ncbi:DNA oxidative demethylase ALKBH2 [Erysiphe neolycopersici]|uniref:DNA oxidative demethylase ALKBH2 n=1 Tax=Erysiphe neolycopersici TaxID=212602 RepID=A0A420HZF7_9PEZI|nr:DNA oxidative demethylase ALKBH2 [Erysiphe neolycopersici]
MNDSEKDITDLSTPNNISSCAKVICNVLDQRLAENVFEILHNEISWQKVSHRGGHLPRLVAIQGNISSDGGIPIYRFPADVMPRLMPISPTVKLIQEQVTKRMGHTVNHVLIQYYRDGIDYISEHSDKTLDIVPDTSIGNFSVGAQRLMVFRTKKSSKLVDGVAVPRQIVRTPLPHNSLCIMDLDTNKYWLHGIRQDKRFKNIDTSKDLDFQAARISLTFRKIGTFISEDDLFIWGQGATAKSKECACPIVSNNNSQIVKILEAFRVENHESNFDWNTHYGTGFDLLHIC